MITWFKCVNVYAYIFCFVLFCSECNFCFVLFESQTNEHDFTCILFQKERFLSTGWESVNALDMMAVYSLLPQEDISRYRMWGKKSSLCIVPMGFYDQSSTLCVTESGFELLHSLKQCI